MAVLGAAWPDARPGDPEPLVGGYWATMFRVPVSGQPEGVADEVVVRHAPSRARGAMEAEVQRAVAAAGVATPALWVSRPDRSGQGWWSVMDLVAGAPPVDGLDGLAALRKARSLARTLPVQLAGAAAALHALDPTPVTAAVRDVAPEVVWSPRAMLDHLRARAVELGRDDVATALTRLEADAPTVQAEVLCHGDLHPLNVLERDGEIVLIDWSGALVADPCFDLAFTELLLANPPVALPRVLAPVGPWVGRVLARRFLAAYRRAAPSVSLGPLPWFGALHSARVIVEQAGRRADGGPEAARHPFALLATAAADRLSAVTGEPVSP